MNAPVSVPIGRVAALTDFAFSAGTIGMTIGYVAMARRPQKAGLNTPSKVANAMAHGAFQKN